MNTQPGVPTTVVVSFGPSHAGAPVGYALLNPDLSVHRARTVVGVTEIGGGFYDAVVNEANPWNGYIEWDTGGGTPVFVREELNVQSVTAVLDPTVQATLDAVKAKTDLIGLGSITALIPVLADGSVQLVAGDDYLLVDGRQLEFTSGSWPNLTGATVNLTIGAVTQAGTVVTPVGAGAKVRFELTAVETTKIRAGLHHVAVSAALADGHVVTLLRGRATVS